MSEDLVFRFRNHVFSQVVTENRGILQELHDHFSFMVPGAHFSPTYKSKFWDGRIRLFKLQGNQLYTGLAAALQDFADDRDYNLRFVDFPSHRLPSPSEIAERIKTFGIPPHFELRDYQLQSIVHCLQSKRALLLSPTSSGKSLLIYCILRHINEKALIVVPNLTLVHQLASDFVSYGYQDNIQKLYSGETKEIHSPIVIGTWQSLHKLPPKFFEQFGAVVIDEAHHAKAKALTSLLESTPNVGWRLGCTGSLDDSLTNRTVLEGLLGPVAQFISTRELMDQGYAANLKIKTVLLKYSDETCKTLKKADYMTEVNWLISNPKRNKFIFNLVKSLTGNTLILYRYVDKHGKILNELFKDQPNVHFIHGKIAGEERNEIRRIINESENAIVIASQGTFAEGINIPRIHNLVFASPSKSRILVMQMIGRGLRKSEDKTECVLYDIADDLSYKKRRNHTLKHYEARLKFYLEEKFKFKQFSTSM